KFFDYSNQSPQSGADNPQDFERNLRMGQTQCLKVVLADKDQRGLVDRCHRCRIVPAIKHRKFSNGTTRPIDTEHLFAPAGRTLKDSYMAGFDDVEPGTRLAFAEHALAG